MYTASLSFCLNVEFHQVIGDCEESILGQLREQVLFETWLSQIARDLHDIVLLIFHHLVELFSCHRAEESALVIEHTVPVQVQFGHWIDHCGSRLVIHDHSCNIVGLGCKDIICFPTGIL